MCEETIFPGINTQGGGHGPEQTGFELLPGDTQKLSVAANWQGRVWGRTNCSFNPQGTGPANAGNGIYTSCDTGDCSAGVQCTGAGVVPVTLAEFTMDGGDGQSFYDISLVDGYNLPMAIVLLAGFNTSLQAIPPNITNPSCVGSVGNMNPDTNYSPYQSGQALFLNTNSSTPLAFDTVTTSQDVSNWCPWELQVAPPQKPGDGVYPYPDDNIERPAFNPCFSACAKNHDDASCCTGKYDSPQACQPNDYSKAAKAVCPDAYSFGEFAVKLDHSSLALMDESAFDDQTSTFITPAGAGFGVVFCPGARSTTILATEFPLVHQSPGSGYTGASPQGLIGRFKNTAPSFELGMGFAVVAACITTALFCSL
ncbi:MAG: hypothetical protein M1820_002175 [Bogoriella megaspora]|nr:MAG: hypothetical protein M1820_002175 [Bogoriella megaspora]